MSISDIEIKYKNDLFNIYSNNNDQFSIARLKSDQVNGTLQWLNVNINHFNGKIFNNTNWNIALSLVLGAKLTNNIKCKICHAKMDEFGYHSLGCKSLPELTLRHNKIRDILYHWATDAGYHCTKEARATNVSGVPGDLFIKDFDFPDNNDPNIIHQMDLWIDVSMINIYADSYLRYAQNTLGAAKLRAKNKILKYQNNIKNKSYNSSIMNSINYGGFNFIPFAMDVTGAITKQSKIILQRICLHKSTKSGIPQSILMNWIRKELNAHLMHYNTKMVIKCIT